MARAGTKAMRMAESDNAALSHATLTNGASPEEVFLATVPLAKRRMRGQFFTPAPIANLMAEWVCEHAPRRVLDPAAGTGVLARAVVAKSKAPVSLTAFEIDPLAAELAQTHGPETMDVRWADFLHSEDISAFDGVIANPPYVRHHDAAYASDVMGALSARTGIPFSRQSNIYVPFVVKCFEALVDGGRAAILVPTEWTNANFGDGLKAFLQQHDALREVIYFSHTGAIFRDNLSTACILLMTKGARPEKIIQGWFVNENADTSSLSALKSDPRVTARTFTNQDLYSARKWNHAFACGVAAPLPGLAPLRALATTMRGLATGANAFFHVSLEAGQSADIRADNLLPCVGRANDASGIVFTAPDFAALEARGRRARLVDLRDDLSAPEVEYIRAGEAAGYPARYLLKARSPWYAQERRIPAPIWAAVFGRGSMRFVLNEAGAQSLTTFHGIYPKDTRPEFAKALCACLNSALVQTGSEAERRVYGGGLMKFEPRDLLNILVPDLRRARAETLRKLCAAFDALAASDTSQTRESLNACTRHAARETAD
jgi:adenine-specific DNA-methyltransferase